MGTWSEAVPSATVSRSLFGSSGSSGGGGGDGDGVESKRYTLKREIRSAKVG